MPDNHEQLERLIGYLEVDPENRALLRDCAQAALDANEAAMANDMFGKLKTLDDLSPADLNMSAIAAMRAGEPERAAETFSGLLEQQPDDPGLRFNLAWARALAKDFAGAQDLLTPDVVASLPQAAQLDITLLHNAGEFEQAAKRAKQSMAQHPDYPPLLAAVSVLAIDVDDEALARSCAQKAGDHPDALATLATLTLGDQEPGKARALFERSLAMNASSPRAWIGLGLTDLAEGKPAEAVGKLDKGAEMFGAHLGSWIAAGWAYLMAGDLETARKRFEHSVSLDGNFAEAQGSLAVAEMLNGDEEAARQRTEVALRLDRQCFSAAFASVIMQAASGNSEKAAKILETAMRQPIDAQGRTIGDAIARMAR